MAGRGKLSQPFKHLQAVNPHKAPRMLVLCFDRRNEDLPRLTGASSQSNLSGAFDEQARQFRTAFRRRGNASGVGVFRTFRTVAGLSHCGSSEERLTESRTLPGPPRERRMANRTFPGSGSLSIARMRGQGPRLPLAPDPPVSACAFLDCFSSLI